MLRKIRLLGILTASMALLFILTYGLSGLFLSLPSIGGVDFFCYICTSRDLVLNIANPSMSRYFYFPGVYVVWSTLMRLVGFDLFSLQAAYLAAIVANIILTATIVFVCVRNVALSLFAATIYLFAAAYTEGTEGCTEVFCTIFFLSGLTAWSTLMTRGHRFGAMTALGICGAATLFIKQQAGLLLLGGFAVLPLLCSRDRIVFLRISHIVAGALSFALTLLGLFHLEGGGLTALQQGLGVIRSYETHSSFVENIQNLKPFSPLIGLVLMTFLLWLVSIFQIRYLSSRELIPVTVLGICLLGGAATIYQFKTRGYLHYALLTDPALATVCALGLFTLLQWTTYNLNPSRAVIGLFAATLSLAPVPYFWDYSLPLRSAINSLSSRQTAQEIMSPFTEICERVPPGSELFLFPPRRNIIHWFCQTKSTAWPGYGWPDVEMAVYQNTFAKSELKNVFVLNKDSIDYNDHLLSLIKTLPIEEPLRDAGFTPTLQLEKGTLFNR